MHLGIQAVHLGIQAEHSGLELGHLGIQVVCPAMNSKDAFRNASGTFSSSSVAPTQKLPIVFLC